MSEGQTCVICGRPAQKVGGELGRRFRVDCKTCGQYNIGPMAQLEIPALDPKAKAMISGVLRERTINGRDPILIVRSSHEEKENDPPFLRVSQIVEELGPRDVAEQLDRTLQNLQRMSEHHGDWIDLKEHDYSVCFGVNADESTFMLDALREASLIQARSEAGVWASLRLTPKGWARVAELQRGPAKDSRKCFVAMWFDPSLDEAWERGFRRAIYDAYDPNFDPVRIDKSEHNEKICDRIIAEIRQSRFLVADFTGHRGGVYFEAGFALGLGIPVIWTCREEDADDSHFDTRQYNHVVWSDPDDLYHKLLRRIQATIPPP